MSDEKKTYETALPVLGGRAGEGEMSEDEYHAWQRQRIREALEKMNERYRYYWQLEREQRPTRDEFERVRRMARKEREEAGK